jgi:hypothetical protein
MRLSRRTNRSLDRAQRSYLTTRTNGRRWSPPNHFMVACRALAKYVRQVERMARQEPHHWGPHASRYHQDTLQMMRVEAEAGAAIRKVYGPPKPGDPPPGPDVWTRRYELDPQWRGFRKWFREQYGN